MLFDIFQRRCFGWLVQVVQPRQLSILAACLVVAWFVSARDVKAELLHFDCVPVGGLGEFAFNLGNGEPHPEILVASDGRKLRCERRTQFGSGLAPGVYGSEVPRGHVADPPANGRAGKSEEGEKDLLSQSIGGFVGLALGAVLVFVLTRLFPI
jgi:hypothetical protein